MDHDQYEDAVTNECVQSDQADSLLPDSSNMGDSYRPNKRQRRRQQPMNLEQVSIPSSADSSSSGGVNGGRGLSGSGTSTGQIFESQATYNPFDIHMGQMTVYRLRISCSCSAPPEKADKGQGKSETNGKKQSRCAKILPFEDQPWTGYMGTHADSYFSLSANPYPHKILSTLPSALSSATSSSSSKSSSNNIDATSKSSDTSSSKLS